MSLTDGALVGAGAGIGTFLFALAESQPTWYAAELDPDNAVFLSLVADAELAGDLAEQPAEPPRPLLPAALSERFGIRERAMTDELRQLVALELARGRPMVGRRELAEHVIELHDDCFFRFESKDPTGMEKVLGGILAQHGGHLRQPGLPAFAPDLQRLLSSRGSLRLQSLPALTRVKVLARAQTGWGRWIRSWIPIGAIAQVDSAWRFVPRGG